MKLRVLAVIVILIGALIVSGCCVCCMPCGTTRGQSLANKQAQPGVALTYSDPAVSLPAYTGSV